MVGEIYVGLSRLLAEKHRYSQDSHISQTLWLSGRCVGSVTLDLSLTQSFYY